MSKISDKISEESGNPFVSFEYFPPRTEKGVANLYARLEKMKSQRPLFADFTWGAGGSTSTLTLELVTNTQVNIGIDANMHLTCTNMDASKVTEALEGARKAGVRNIVALRGDPPLGQDEWTATEDGFTCALDLIRHIRREHDDFFCVSASCYPEGHPNVIKKVEEGRVLSASERGRLVTMADGDYVCSDEDFAKELAYVKEKVDAGAEVLISQMFFDAEVFLAFVAAARAAGITVPILPGIMIIQAYGGCMRMTGFCKSRLPEDVRQRLEALKEDDAAVKAYGIELATAICRRLLDSGAVPGLHFYTLNQSKSVMAILANLDMLVTEEESEKNGDDAYAMGRHTILSESYENVIAAAAAKKNAPQAAPLVANPSTCESVAEESEEVVPAATAAQ